MSKHYIPNYGLYGESRQSAAAVGIHIEEIEERSRGQNWVIKPHRHGKLFQVLCIFDGEATVKLDENRYQIDGWSLVTIPIGVVHGFSFKPDSQGVVVTLSEETLGSINQLQDAEYLRPVLENAAVLDMNAAADQREQLQNYLALMRQEFTAANDDKFISLLLLVNLLLITIKRQVDYQAMGTAAAPAHLKAFDAFRRLIEKHFREHWQVADYATALNVSTSTLNRMCHERFGSSAKSIIVARVISEAKRRLVYTQQSLDQIAYYLGYKDPAYFSRVFKKMENLSPGEYRRLIPSAP
ncbi:MAG: helix-turn-helix domain-containing protein [Halieaceae bacterium]|nr:helix-turn-helix domain-containing protein [Halieaceae bacterium]